MKNYLIILYLCLFVVMIGFGLILPVMPFYIERMALTETTSSAAAAKHVGMLTGSFALMQFLFSPVWGKWSDRIGRRPLFLTGLGGYAIGMLCFGMGTSLEMLYTARIFSGIFSAAIFPAATAYVSDVTALKDRGQGMAWLGSAISLGIVVGPAIGAFMVRMNRSAAWRFGPFSIDDFSVPFFATALLASLAFATALLWLPESLKIPGSVVIANQEIEKDGSKSILPLGIPHRGRHGVARSFDSSWLIEFLILAFISQLALTTFEGTFALHARKTVDYGPEQMGAVFVVCGLVMAVAQGAIISWLMEKAGEKILLSTGFTLAALGLAFLMFADNRTFILAIVGLFALGIAFITPTLSALISKKAAKHPGKALGLLNSANNLGQAAGPLMSGFLLARQVHLPFGLAAFLLGISAVYLTVKKVGKF